MTNRFKGVGLIDRVPEELWTEVHNTTTVSDQKTPPRKINEKSKMVLQGSRKNN